MDEQRPPDAVGAPSDGAGIPPEPPKKPATPLRHFRGPIGIAAALVLAFVWGGLAYRELGPGATSTKAFAGVVPAAAVAGSQAPPGWIGDFASAFCDGDARSLATHIGPPLSGNVAGIEQALADRDWSCTAMRYLGAGTNPNGTFYVYLMRGESEGEQWWVFTVVDEKVVAIE